MAGKTGAASAEWSAAGALCAVEYGPGAAKVLFGR